jgi:hypothetical protein
MTTDNKTKKLIEKAQLEDTLKQEFDFSLKQRVERYLDVKPHGIIPNSHFAAVSAECHLLYRDGHYYGTISLTQAVAEALVKFLCNINGWKPCKEFEKTLQQLEKKKKITKNLENLFTNIWQRRDDYHHLNPQIEQDRQKLEALAKEKLSGLKKIEEELFAYSTNNGRLVPKYQKYWDQKDGKTPVYLRFD